MRERMIWISAGLLGLLLAAALASATSRVSTPDVGLAGEPVSAGEALAPPAGTSGGTAQPLTATPARAAKHVTAKKKKVSAKRAASSAKKQASKAIRAPALAATAPKAATAPVPRSRTTTTATTAKKATAVIKPTTVKRKPPVIV